MRKLLFFALVILSLTAVSCSSDDNTSQGLPAVLKVEINKQESFEFGQTRTFTYTSENIKDITATAPLGWEVEVTSNSVILTAPIYQNNTEVLYSGDLTLKAVSIDNPQNTVEIESEVQVNFTKTTITFEDVDKNFLAGPTSYGENLYPHYSGDNPPKYLGYKDPTTGLFFHTTTSGYGFASGGLVISNWNDKQTAGFGNQTSVYYGDHNEKNGGNNNSSTFVVGFAPTMGEPNSYMIFQEEDKEYILESAYFTNNTYAVLSMTDGDGFARAHSYENKDFFKLIIIGYDLQGEKTGQVECYLSDFTEEDRMGILKEWVKTDLSSLGKVNKIAFQMESSDGSGYWMNTPAYFCMDDITIISR